MQFQARNPWRRRRLRISRVVSGDSGRQSPRPRCNHQTKTPLMPSGPLRGQKALVTGANSGIGQAVAIALGRAGADVVVNYVQGDDAADAVVKQVRQSGAKAFA